MIPFWFFNLNFKAMKRYLLLLILLPAFTLTFSQGIRINLQNTGGITIVDVKKVIGSELNDWNTYSYEFAVQALLKSRKEGFKWVPEIGIHRLYYWEEKYFVYTPDPSPRWRWGTIWTAHSGLNIQQAIGEKTFVQAGANARIFLDGSGVVPGFMAGIGYRIHLSDFIAIPVGLRTDIILGNSTPIALGLSVGIELGK